MRLYVLERCPFGHRAVFAATEKALPAEIVFFDRHERPPELTAIGPRAKSPTLVDGSVAVHDSLVVLEYLEERYPERPLLPEDAAGRARVRMEVTRISDELLPKYGALIREVLFTARPDPAKIDAARQELLDALPAWDRHLDGRAYVAEEMFSLADIVLYTMFPAAIGAGGVVVPESLPNLRGWLERTSARPGATVPMRA